MARVESVPAISNSCLPFGTTNSIAIPATDRPDVAQGAGPNVSDTLNTFVPEGRGVIVPLSQHPVDVPPQDDPVTVPVGVMFKANSSSRMLSIKGHEPVISARFAAVL